MADLLVLLDALASPKPERDLAARLSESAGGEAAVLAPWGEVLAGRAVPGAARREVRDEGRLLGTLLLSGEDADAWLAAAAPVYALAVLQRRAREARAAAADEVLLAELLGGARAPDLPERLDVAGLAGEPFAVAVAELPARRARSRPARAALHAALDRLREAGDAFFAARGFRALSAVRGGRAVWGWATPDPAPQLPALLAALLAATDEDVRLGASAPHDGPLAGPHALREAILAAQGTREERAAASFEALDPLHWLLSTVGGDALDAWRRRLLGPLRAADDDGKLLATLRAYLQDPDHRGALAERLHVHPNTLRHRLGRIEELLGQPLGHPATLARLYLALGAEEA